jgi:hypothetical protein
LLSAAPAKPARRKGRAGPGRPLAPSPVQGISVDAAAAKAALALEKKRAKDRAYRARKREEALRAAPPPLPASHRPQSRG